MAYKINWIEEMPLKKIIEAAHIKAAKGMEAAGRYLGVSAKKAETLFSNRLTEEERIVFFGSIPKKAAPIQKMGIEFDPSDTSEQIFNPSAKYVNLRFNYE